MGEPEVRQWSDHLFGVYVDLGERYPTFIGTEESRDAATALGRERLSDLNGRLETRCKQTDSGRASHLSEHACAVESGLLNSDGPRSVTTPAHLPLVEAGASS